MPLRMHGGLPMIYLACSDLPHPFEPHAAPIRYLRSQCDSGGRLQHQCLAEHSCPAKPPFDNASNFQSR